VRIRRAGAAVLSSLAAAGLVLVGGASKWQVVQISSARGTDLDSVTAPGSRTAWAAGVTGLTKASVFGDALVLQWNGSRWRRSNILAGVREVDQIAVASSAPGNVWLVAQTYSFTSGGSQYVMRWNGSSWKTEPQPADDLSQILVLSPTDVWGRGSIGCVRDSCKTVIWHWNGKTWLKTSIPGMMTEMFGAAHDVVWADGSGHPDAYRWTGHVWSAVRSLPGPPSFIPGAGAAVSPNDVWLSGTDQSGGQAPVFQLRHWNGRTWSKITVPIAIAAGAVTQLVPDGSGGVWYDPDAHWTGKRWVITTPGKSFAAGQGKASLFALARIPGSASLWGVGLVNSAGKRQNNRFLIARYSPTS
jgi:hypothetical protein